MAKYLKQFALIIVVTLCGEFLKYFLPFKIPASIYGLILMFSLLSLKVIKVEDVKETSQFLLEIMPVMFIPPTMRLLNYGPLLKTTWLPLTLAGTVGTLIVLFVSGRVTQFWADRQENNPSSGAANDRVKGGC